MGIEIMPGDMGCGLTRCSNLATISVGVLVEVDRAWGRERVDTYGGRRTGKRTRAVWKKIDLFYRFTSNTRALSNLSLSPENRFTGVSHVFGYPTLVSMT